MTDGFFADTATLTADQAARLHASNIRVLRRRIRLHDAATGHGPCPSTAGLRQELADETELLGSLQASDDDYPYELAGDAIPARPRAVPAGSTTPTEGEDMTTATGETYTHRSWLDWADGCVGQLDDLNQALDRMCAQIGDDDGDQAQIEAIRTWQAQISDTATAGRQMVEQVNARQLPVGEAVAAAGGSASTPHKQYADEARSA